MFKPGKKKRALVKGVYHRAECFTAKKATRRSFGVGDGVFKASLLFVKRVKVVCLLTYLTLTLHRSSQQ